MFIAGTLKFASTFKVIYQFEFLFGCSENIYLIKQWSWKKIQLIELKFLKIKVRVYKDQYKSPCVEKLLV